MDVTPREARPDAVRSDGTPGVRLVAPEEVHAEAVRALGLDAASLDLESPEGLAGLVRRAASLVTPCALRTLRETTVRGLEGLVADEERLRERVDAAIEELVSYGDLLELPAPDEEVIGSFVYLAPPSFVARDSGLVYLIGGLRDGVEMLPIDLRARVEHINHTRRLAATPSEDMRARLSAFGLVDLPERLWLPPPRHDSAEQTVDRANGDLERAPSRGEVPGLLVLDWARPVMYYKGRWREPAGRTGRYIARRDRRYGAALWSYVELVDGQVTKLLDLPRGEWRGCDEAWYLQLAIDAVGGHPQRYRCRGSAPAGSVIIDFFSPVPQWARRRWDVLGASVAPVSSLFAYRFPADVFADERRFLENDLWLVETT